MNHLLLRSVFVCLLLALTGVLPAAPTLPAGTTGIGLSGFRVDRWPRYDSVTCTVPEPATGGGSEAILVPGTACGGYRISTSAVVLAGGQRYVASLDIRNVGRLRVTMTVFAGGKVVAREEKVLESGHHPVSLVFVAAGSHESNTGLAHIARVEMSSKQPSRIEVHGIYPAGKEKAAQTGGSVTLLKPDRPLGIYEQGGAGAFTLKLSALPDIPLRYQITDGLSGVIVATGEVKPASDNSIVQSLIRLHTVRRGFFEVQVISADEEGSGAIIARRGYLVLGRTQAADSCSRYGVTMEHHGRKTYSDGLIPVEELYALARRMGAGSARIFTLAAPQMLSGDGEKYDFSQLDGALTQIQSAGLEPLILLGSESIFQLPAWLRNRKPSDNSINLLGGMRNPSMQSELRNSDAGYYLDLDRYAEYLDVVMTHLRGRDYVYSLWNEPGHKFQAADIERIARLTASIRDSADPSARIAGYSSTTGLAHDRRKHLGQQPLFLQAVSASGGLKHIDVLSFHSAHFLRYLGPTFDQRDLDTGFVKRLQTLLQHHHDEGMAIWDTERGTPWQSRHVGRIDRRSSGSMDDALHRVGDWLEPTRRLAALYAAAFADGVERLYWFSLDSSSHAPLEVPDSIRAMFDAHWEPMPHIAAYAAITEILGCSEYSQTIEGSGGDRAWMFSDARSQKVLAYNWQQKDSNLQINQSCNVLNIYDVMGNPVLGQEAKDGCIISTGEWMSYIKYNGENRLSVKWP